jgi:2-polyprenyl-3-methyl-5-hydroxy-6-metoxy-1,4-benzoquinol methylase
MPMAYPTPSDYAHLYARYLTGRRTEQMLDAAGPLDGLKIVDFCAGGGRLSRMALARGAQVTAVDESALMLNWAVPGIETHVRSVESWATSFAGTQEFDAVFCQQAVNYWLTPHMAQEVADILKPGGVFVFNTFNRAPSRVPTVKQYELDGATFVEASWLTGTNTVEHVQMREGEAPHTTQFQWISQLEYRNWLSAFFELTEIVEGASSVWVCTRRT